MQDYKDQVIEDIKEWAKEGNAAESLEATRERLQDPSESDSITGNASGSYYCNRYKAEEMLNKSGVIWDDEFLDYLKGYGVELAEIMAKGPEAVDVWARCIAVDILTDKELAEALKED